MSFFSLFICFFCGKEFLKGIICRGPKWLISYVDYVQYKADKRKMSVGEL